MHAAAADRPEVEEPKKMIRRVSSKNEIASLILQLYKFLSLSHSDTANKLVIKTLLSKYIQSLAVLIDVKSYEGDEDTGGLDATVKERLTDAVNFTVGFSGLHRIGDEQWGLFYERKAQIQYMLIFIMFQAYVKYLNNDGRPSEVRSAKLEKASSMLTFLTKAGVARIRILRTDFSEEAVFAGRGYKFEMTKSATILSTLRAFVDAFNRLVPLIQKSSTSSFSVTSIFGSAPGGTVLSDLLRRLGTGDDARRDERPAIVDDSVFACVAAALCEARFTSEHQANTL